MTRQCQWNNRGCGREGATERQKGWEEMQRSLDVMEGKESCEELQEWQ